MGAKGCMPRSGDRRSMRSGVLCYYRQWLHAKSQPRRRQPFDSSAATVRPEQRLLVHGHWDKQGICLRRHACTCTTSTVTTTAMLEALRSNLSGPIQLRRHLQAWWCLCGRDAVLQPHRWRQCPSILAGWVPPLLRQRRQTDRGHEHVPRSSNCATRCDELDRLVPDRGSAQPALFAVHAASVEVWMGHDDA